MTEGSLFPTFCHIGEYDEAGYRMLHRMLAMSQPLILWAPTSPQLEHEQCRIPPQAFLRYVDEGRIRVLAREEWLISRSFRDSRPYPGARWTGSFDAELKKKCEEDASLPVEQRRVAAAPAEGGWEWAEEYLADKPGQIARWNRLARSKAAASKVPAGTLQAASRYAGDDPAKLAKAILRDAYNHGDAIRLSGAEVPFLLSAADRRFLDILGETADPARRTANRSRGSKPHVPFAPPADPPSIDETSVELAGQLLDVLWLLDIRAAGTRSGRDLDRFLRGDGHQQLVEWLSRMCSHLKQVDARNLDNAVITALQADLGRGKLARPLHDMIRHPVAASVGAIGLVTTVMTYAIDPTDALSTAGFITAAVQVATGLFRALGYIPASFTGPQWPFLYTYGSPATKRQMAPLLGSLSEA
jgi:hypothetical protein